jgi:membrane protein
MLERWKVQILESALVRKSILIAKRIKLPGFQGLSLFQILQFVLVGIGRGRITNRAAAVAFRVLLAAPPLLIVLLSVIPFIPIENFQESLFLYLSKAMPTSAFELFESTLNDLITKKQQTLLSISFILALVFASNAIQAILDGFSYSYNIENPQGVVIQYVRSFGLMFVLSLMLVLGVALITLTGPVLSWLEDLNITFSESIYFLINVAKWLLVILFFEIGISVLYRAGHTGRWRAFNAGASFATLGLIIVSSGFAWYVNNFGNYNKLYGSVGTVLVVMLWLYLNSIVLLIGFEINAGLERAKGSVEELEAEDVLSASSES